MLKPHFSRQIIPVAGDITADGLGIGDADRQHLESNVSVVVHLAATLSFTETLGYYIMLLFCLYHQLVVCWSDDDDGDDDDGGLQIQEFLSLSLWFVLTVSLMSSY